MKIKDKDISFGDTAELNFDHSEDTAEKSIYYYLKIALFSFAGLCFSLLECLGTISPFTAAFLSAVDYSYCFPAFLFGSLGYFISQPWQGALKYTFSCAAICILRLIINKRFHHLDKGKVNYIGAFLCIFIPGIIFLAFSGINFTSVFMLICESLLAFCASLFFIRSFKTPVMRIGISSLSIKDSTSIVISIGIFLMCMSGFNIEGLSPARILSSILIMFLSLYKGSSLGAVGGVLVGSALCIDSSLRYLFPCYALAGLVSGVFSPLGQIVTAIAYGVSFSLICLIGNTSSDVLICLVETAIASASFMLIPSRWITSLQDYLLKSGIVSDNQLSSQVSAQLHAAANNIYDVAKVVTGVSEKLDGIINPEVNRLFAALQQRVCTSCTNKSKCWHKMFDSTASDILCLAGIEKKSPGKLPIEKRCPRRELLISEIQAALPDYTNNIAMKMKVREMRKVLTDEFCAMGDFLKETADKVQGSRIADTARSTAVRTALQDAGIYTDALCFFTDNDGRVTIEISIIDRPFETDHKKLKNILEFLSKRRFSEPTIAVSEIKTTIIFYEKASFEVQFGYSQKPLKKGGLCGDSVSFIPCPDGNKAALISDGMGTGSRAAIDSTMTSSIAEKLISGGFSVAGAIKTLNSAMIMKSTDESIASVDCVSINTYTGVASFYKSGAAISFIRSGNEVYIVKLESLPVGIIRNISPASESVQLESGDIILLVSDGVTAKDCGWINDELLSWSTNNMEDLASHIASLALLRSDKNTRDDITAVALKITKSK
ncbi:MAG: SpoIIE family protein phosphatase [Clostridia bacterium]|nr:SpoIIE family protein phosphatase [Clostridia bacterium]